jgi:hypothetical protein
MELYVEEGYVDSGFFVTTDTEASTTPRRGGGGRLWPSFPQDVLIVGETDNGRLKSRREEILFIFKP